MWRITDNLYLAQLSTVERSKCKFRKNKISRVLTMMPYPVQNCRRMGYVDYKHLPLLDFPSEPILENGILEQSILYIEDAVNNEERVVVHCLAAVSRSVSMCVGYLMWKNHWSLEKALKEVQTVRKPVGNPNAGFLAQLKIWEKCGMDFTRDRYKNLKTIIPGVSDDTGKYLWRQPVIDDKTKVRFRCRSCGDLLFSTENITHSVTENCQKYLIEPMDWLTVTGLSCSLNHTCGAELGKFYSHGSRCNGCSKYVKQYICVEESKVDKVEPF